MAYSVRFTGFRKSDGSEIFILEPSWWTEKEVKKLLTCRWIVSNDTGSYRDEDADISVEQARALHAHFAPAALHQIAFNEDCVRAIRLDTDENAASRLATYVNCVSALKREFDSVETAVGADCDQYSHFHVCIFEWESGL
jgi:hypothetical protein